MHPPNHRPTEMYLGTSDERRDLLRQETPNSRVARWGRTIARVAVILSVVILTAMVVLGPGATMDWVGTYLVPVAAILTVGLCVLVLLVRLTKRLPKGHDLSDWWQ